MLKILFFLVCCSVRSVLAQIPVTDGLSLTQNTITAVQTAAQAANQLIQMERDLKYMENQVESLGKLGWKDPHTLQRHLDFFDSLKNRTDSLTYNYKNLDSNFRRLYSTKDKPAMVDILSALKGVRFLGSSSNLLDISTG